MLISLTWRRDGRPAAEYLSVTDQASVLDRFLRLMRAVGLELREWGWTEFTILSGSIGPLLMLVGWSWLTQARLAKILKVTLLTISRWERNETSINDVAEMLVRLHSVTKLELEVNLDVETVSEKVTASAWTQEIRIDGSNPGHYRLLDAA